MKVINEENEEELNEDQKEESNQNEFFIKDQIPNERRKIIRSEKRICSIRCRDIS